MTQITGFSIGAHLESAPRKDEALIAEGPNRMGCCTVCERDSFHVHNVGLGPFLREDEDKEVVHAVGLHEVL